MLKEFDTGYYSLKFAPADNYVDYEITDFGVVYTCALGNKVIVEQVKY